MGQEESIEMSEGCGLGFASFCNVSLRRALRLLVLVNLAAQRYSSVIVFPVIFALVA